MISYARLANLRGSVVCYPKKGWYLNLKCVESFGTRFYSVKTRMTSSTGISFAEFSYQLLQAHDFWYLYNHYGCRIQVGGSDQWGNIVAGMDVIARRESDVRASDGERVHGVTTPLLISSFGQKFGKSAGNATWLDREKTSVFDFYQARTTLHPLYQL